MTLEEIGKRMDGITKERARQLYVRGMKRLELLARNQKHELS
jgi:DNA-directed RNA polymerase sigma subunit (sigma70/sigma32)